MICFLSLHYVKLFVTIHLIRSVRIFFSTTPVPAVRGNKRKNTKEFRAF